MQITGESRQEVSKCANPLRNSADRVVNIINGCVASEKMNMPDIVGTGQRISYLRDGFHKIVHARVHSMQTVKKTGKVSTKTIYNMEELHGRPLLISQEKGCEARRCISF